ncbi:MAG: hypothetical protein HFG08_02690 [Oscillibacter sp.]|nr:hypothetical protein [Oscillibacter sp.]
MALQMDNPKYSCIIPNQATKYKKNPPKKEELASPSLKIGGISKAQRLFSLQVPEKKRRPAESGPSAYIEKPYLS